MKRESPIARAQDDTESLRRAKAIVLDLDGTLLRSDLTINERTHQALKGVSDLGLELIIATARPPRSVAGIIPMGITAADYFIYYNGALITSRRSGYCQHRALDADIVRNILIKAESSLAESGLTFETADRWVCLPSLSVMDRKMLREKYGEAPEEVEREELLSSPILKMLWRHSAPLSHLLDQFANQASVLVTDGGTLVQLSAGDARKESAVAFVLEEKGIDASDVIVFGDDYNDLGLFRLCGIPIAMGNAVTELKELSVHITGSNDDDGAAMVLEQLAAEKRR